MHQMQSFARPCVSACPVIILLLQLLLQLSLVGVLCMYRGICYTKAARLSARAMSVLCPNKGIYYRHTFELSGMLWCRSVVKSGGQGQSAIKLFQITPCVSDFQTVNNPSTCREPVWRLEKIVLPSIFDTNLSLM